MDQAIFISKDSAFRWIQRYRRHTAKPQPCDVYPVFKQRGLVGYTAVVGGIPVTNNEVEKEHV